MLFVVIYFASMRLIYTYNIRERASEVQEEIKEHKFTMKQVIIRYA